MPETGARWLWYEKPGFVIAALIVFWPLGLILMWTQEKFTRGARVGLSVALPVISIIVAVAALPGSGAPSVQPATGPAAAETTSATVPATSTASNVSSAGVSTTRSPGVGSKGASATPSPKPSPAPAPAPAQPGAAQTRFTLKGTYKPSGAVTFTLRATQITGIVKYEWWVTALDRTTRYTGLSVSDSYIGHPPDSVMLVATDSARMSYISTAKVTITGESMFAEAK